MTSVSSSKLPTGSRTERSTTSLIASRFRERCDPFWSCGRSTNKSSVVVSVTARFGRRIWTGLTTPVTPTLFNRNPFATRSLWTSFGIDSTRPGLPSRTLTTCRRQCAALHRGAPRRTGGGGHAEGSTCSSFAHQSFRSKWQRKRSRGPLPALRRGSPEALAGGRWLGGGLLSVSAEADEAVVVEGDRPHLPGRLDRLRRLHLDVDCVVVLLLDLLRRVLDFLGEGREVRLRQVVDDPLDDRDDHVANDLHRFVEGHLVGEPVQRIVLHDDHAVRLATELLETLSGGFRPTFDLEWQDRNADRHGPVRARGPRDDGRGSGSRSAAKSRDDGDFRGHGILKQAADDFLDVIPGYHCVRPPHSATDRGRPEGSSLH